jgi:hypothetical protein
MDEVIAALRETAREILYGTTILVLATLYSRAFTSG